MCMLCMVVIAGIFLIQRGSDELRLWLGMMSIQLRVHLPASARMMSMQASYMIRSAAMVLVFVCAAAAWTMSNGMILKPRKNGFGRLLFLSNVIIKCVIPGNLMTVTHMDASFWQGGV